MIYDVISFLVGGLGGSVFIIVITLALRLFRQVRLTAGADNFRDPPPASIHWAMRPLPLLGMAAIEELLARALLIGWLHRYVGYPIAFALSAVIFFALHIPNGKVTWASTVNLLLVSVFFGIVYVRFGLWAAVGVHYGWNLMQWPVLGYPMYGWKVGKRWAVAPVGREVWSGGEYGPEYSVATTILLSLLIVAAAVWKCAGSFPTLR